MIQRKQLLDDLVKQVKFMERDLSEQVALHLPETAASLKAEYARAARLNRASDTEAVWIGQRVMQAAVAWVLGTVFVRFCEDNGLIADPFLAGPTPERMMLAEERQAEFLGDDAARTHRDWLLSGFAAVGAGQVGKLLFDPKHNALYQIGVSHDAAKALIDFWRGRDQNGVLVHDFVDPEWDTRFLGDLYQDLSDAVRKQYALLQTPEFVEEFILDRTLTPAIAEFGYDVVKVIDPTCGSGHFVLGAFRRILAEWTKHKGSMDVHERVKYALEQVHGVDINPYAIAVARFRLLTAAMKVAGIATLAEADRYKMPLNLAVGDSLIKHRMHALEMIGDESGEDLADHKFNTEDLDDYPGILAEGRYHVVVGNPPYIVPNKSMPGDEYKMLYSACYRQYALSIPFAQRFFELALPGDEHGKKAGHVGQITANSFMKREFGKRLIEEFFAHKVDLTQIIDTSGAYIPGHGTPTVILVGRRRSRGRGDTIRAVLGKRGEPSAPEVASEGLVWQAIVEQIGQPGSETAWLSVADATRSRFDNFPWSLSGGGAGDLLAAVEGSKSILSAVIDVIGRTTHTGLDDAYYLDAHSAATRGLADSCVPAVLGEDVRDFTLSPSVETLFPYDAAGRSRGLTSTEEHFFWLNRQVLFERIDFGQKPVARGLRWFDHSMFFPDRFRSPLVIAFAFVATHNHFVLDRGGKVFNRSAPVIKLPEGATEEEHLRLLGVLNSSTACFWLKQVSQSKGNGGIGGGISDELWEHRFEFTGTKLQEFPLPAEYPIELAKQLHSFSQRLAAKSPAAIAANGVLTHEQLAGASESWHHTRAQMIAAQEELDWQVYSLYNLLADDLRAPADSVPELKLGERAFEIVLAEKVANGEDTTEWFNRHGSTPITELPAHWPDAYKQVVRKRIEVIKSNPNIALIERPECKRRWATEGWEVLQEKALRDWLQTRAENRDIWFRPDENGTLQPQLLTIAELADELAKDKDFVQVAEIYAPGKEIAAVLPPLLADEHVPFLPQLRYKPSGLAKRKDWEETWRLQRLEDEAITEPEKRRICDEIKIPPKYTGTDFLKASYWRNRGKLDVPKERFISYPYASSAGDPSLLLGWAGFDHREQSQALAILVTQREQYQGWGREQLTPLLAGMLELQPWVKQWHSDFDLTIGVSPADVYSGFLTDYQNRFNLTEANLRNWQPSKPTKKAVARKPAAKTTDTATREAESTDIADAAETSG